MSHLKSTSFVRLSLMIAVLFVGGLSGCSSSDDDGGTTPPTDTTAPAQVADFLALPGDGQVTLSWTRPLDSDFAGVEIRRADDATPTRTTGSVVYDGTAASHVDATVTNDETYYYAAFAYDNAGNYAAGAGNSCTPHVAAAVAIADENLEATLRTELGIPSGDITDLAMATLTELDASYDDIADLQGLQHAINLAVLDVSDNPLTNDSNLQILAQLPRLEDLDLSSTEITILPDLSALMNLEVFTFLDVEITSLGPLDDVTSLKRIQFGYCTVSDLSPLANLTNLERISFNNTEVASLGPLSGLTNLRYLSVNHSLVADASAVTGLPNLTSLSVIYSAVVDVEHLSSMSQLWGLNLSGNPIEDISPLSALTGLNYIGLDGLGLTDLTPLAGMTDMIQIQMGNNQVRDLSPLSGMAGLQYLTAYGNLISDVSVLLGLSELVTVSLENNPLTTSAVTDDLPALESSGVDVNFSYDPAVLQLMGPWVADSVTVNDEPASMAEFFEWDETVIASHLTVFPHRGYRTREVDADDEILYHETGFLEIDGDSVSVMVHTENGEDITPREAFAATWVRNGDELRMTAEEGGDTIVLTWAR